jgi:putative PIN family toxin of toxin-antitoxin system
MARAVLDSSALISAFLTPAGTCAQLLHAADRGAFVLCLSPPLIAETAGVLLREAKLQRSYGYDRTKVEAFCDTLSASTQLATELPDLAGAVPLDPKDDMIVATAVAAKADYLITGDRKHLLERGTYDGIRIVTPRVFLELLGKSAA